MSRTIQSTVSAVSTVTMDQGHADLFDPLLEGKEAGGGPGNGSDGVMVEDLLGGFSQLVAPDSKVGDANGPVTSSATSFFLLDLDTGGGGGGDVPVTDFKIGTTEALRPTSAIESISDNSDVLSITEANLPMDEGNDALMSGFFNDVLQADSVPDGATLANAATVQNALHSTSATSATSANSATTSSETTLVGEDMASAVTSMGNGLLLGASEENLDSIMDLEVPTEPSRDLFDTTEVEPMHNEPSGNGRLVKVSTVENLVTEEEGVIGEPVIGEDVKQLLSVGGKALSDEEVEHSLAKELRPIFEMFDPEGKGWIGVEQLQELCQSQGQVAV